MCLSVTRQAVRGDVVGRVTYSLELWRSSCTGPTRISKYHSLFNILTRVSFKTYAHHVVCTLHVHLCLLVLPLPRRGVVPPSAVLGKGANSAPLLASYSACHLIKVCSQRTYEKHKRSMVASDVLGELPDTFAEVFDKHWECVTIWCHAQ